MTQPFFLFQRTIPCPRGCLCRGSAYYLSTCAELFGSNGHNGSKGCSRKTERIILALSLALVRRQRGEAELVWVDGATSLGASLRFQNDREAAKTRASNFHPGFWNHSASSTSRTAAASIFIPVYAMRRPTFFSSMLFIPRLAFTKLIYYSLLMLLLHSPNLIVLPNIS